MKWLRIILLLGVGVLPAGRSEGKALPTILFLLGSDRAAYRAVIEGFREEIEVTAQTFDLGGKVERGVRHLEGLTTAGAPPDLVVLIGHEALLAYLRTKPPLPALYLMVLNPWKSGVDPKEIPGVSLNFSPAQALPLLRLTFPRRRRIGIPFDPVYTGETIREIEGVAKDVTIVPISVLSSQALPECFEPYAEKIDLLWLLPDKTVVTRSGIDFLFRRTLHRIPIVGYNRAFLSWGAVAALTLDYRDIGRQGATIAARILAGERVFGIFPPRRIELRLNLKIAHRMGITFPRKAIEQAKEIVR